MQLTDFYDDTDPKSIENYGKKLIGHTFLQVLIRADDIKQGRPVENLDASTAIVHINEDTADGYRKMARKGGLGNLIEEQYFGYKANSSPEPDFPKAGVELKVSPYEKKNNGSLKAGERLVLTMIEYNKPVEPELFKSHLWKKCRLILLIYYWRDAVLKEEKRNLDYPIDYVTLFTPPEEDQEIIKADYEKIIGKIQAGKADEISEGDTMYLGACTKGATAAKSWVPQYYGDHHMAKKRAFCFKSPYMTFVLNHYVVPGVNTSERIIKNLSDLQHTDFETYIQNRINKNIGKTDFELCQDYNRGYTNNKSQWITLAYRMLGIKSNHAEEFEKANIVVKAIRLEANGKITENSPLPAFHFMDILKEDWEDSVLYNYLTNTKFLFVVYKKQGGRYILKGCQLWNMSLKDLNGPVKEVWEKTREVIRKGVKLKKISKGFSNNLPKQSENPVMHVRPHAKKSYYKLEDGTVYGSGTYADGNPLPDGRWMTNQSFWLNNTYILKQLKEELKS